MHLPPTILQNIKGPLSKKYKLIIFCCIADKDKGEMRVSISLNGLCFNSVCQVPATTSSLLFLLDPGQKAVWVQHELASAGHLQSPAICQRGTNQHFTHSLPRCNRLWRRQKEMWRDGEMECTEGKRGTKIETENERKQAGRPLLRI